jgi:hypothetical protein
VVSATIENMKKLCNILLALLLTTVSLFAVTLEWCPSPDSWVSGYKIHYGTGQTTNWTPDIIGYSDTNNPCSGVVVTNGSNWLRVYTMVVDIGTNRTCTITNLTIGVTYYFAATAYDSNGLESLPSNEVSYTVPVTPTNPPSKVTYLGTRLEWWTNMMYISKQNFSLISFTNSPPNQFYRSYLIITNRWNLLVAPDGISAVKIVDLKTRLEWWTNMMYINKQVFDLKSFTNPPNPQFYRSFLVITNKPF